MIRFALVCDRRHEFEAWFASSDDFEQQSKRKLVICPRCGSDDVTKAIMAPNVAAKSNKAENPAGRKVASGPDLPELIRKFREHVARTSENVGGRFAEEARKIHYEEAEARGIYGSASDEEARDLREEGIEFHPLPALPEEKN